MWQTLIHFARGPDSAPFIVHWRSGNIMKITRQQWQCLVVTLVTTWLSPEIGSSPGIGRGCLVSAGRGGCRGRKQFHFLHPATGSRTQITCCRSPQTWAVVAWDEVINTQWYMCIGAEGSSHPIFELICSHFSKSEIINCQPGYQEAERSTQWQTIMH